MTNTEKVNAFLEKAGVFYFLTTDGVKPKGRPFGFRILADDKLYFGCGTFKNVYHQLTENPHVEILAVAGDTFMRYDGIATPVHDEKLLQKTREAMPELMAMYDKNGWTMGLFYLDNGHVEIRGLFDVIEEFDV